MKKTFDKDMQQLSLAVYSNNEKFIPQNWKKISSKKGKMGFYAETFYNGNKLVISFRGTDDFLLDFVTQDIQMSLFSRIPTQYDEAQKYYYKIREIFPSTEIVFTGHSLGGSFTQLMNNSTNNKAITFNCFGVKNLLKDNISETT